MSVIIPAASVDALFTLMSCTILVFSLCEDDTTSRIANVILATLNREARAPVDLDNRCGSIVQMCSTKNLETEEFKM